MSRIGRLPVPVPQGVDIQVAGQKLTVKGKLGAQVLDLHRDIEAKLDAGKLVLTPRSESKRNRALWGTSRALLANMVSGVSKGFTRNLAIEGTGFRAALEGKVLSLQLGFSHEVKYPIPEGVTIKVAGDKQNALEISGGDKRLVGQVAAEIRGFKKPEPYQGKGIRYAGEQVRRKEGKKK
jgi:large subunit ribosomal protein L6